MTKLAFIVSSPETAVAFLTPHFETLIGEYEIILFANTDATNWTDVPEVAVQQVEIQRTPNLFKDLKAVNSLRKYFNRQRFDIVQSVTPKAGLLAMTAGRMARTPVRIHWFTGQVWATRSGLARAYLKFADKFTSRMATHLLVDSPSQRDFLIQQKIAPAKKMTVLGSGSICGVDTDRFSPDIQAREQVRRDLDINSDESAFLFIGRLNRDKGIYELLMAFSMLHEFPNTHLILVGHDEENIQEKYLDANKERINPKIHFIGHTRQPEKYMAASDIFVMPSHREGFGLSVIEAAAVGLPCIASNIYGLNDAIRNGETGILFAPGDWEDLNSKMVHALSNKSEVAEWARRASVRVETEFYSQRLTDLYKKYLKSTLICDSYVG